MTKRLFLAALSPLLVLPCSAAPEKGLPAAPSIGPAAHAGVVPSGVPTAPSADMVTLRIMDPKSGETVAIDVPRASREAAPDPLVSALQAIEREDADRGAAASGVAAHEHGHGIVDPAAGPRDAQALDGRVSDKGLDALYDNAAPRGDGGPGLAQALSASDSNAYYTPGTNGEPGRLYVRVGDEIGGDYHKDPATGMAVPNPRAQRGSQAIGYARGLSFLGVASAGAAALAWFFGAAAADLGSLAGFVAGAASGLAFGAKLTDHPGSTGGYSVLGMALFAMLGAVVGMAGGQALASLAAALTPAAAAWAVAGASAGAAAAAALWAISRGGLGWKYEAVATSMGLISVVAGPISLLAYGALALAGSTYAATALLVSVAFAGLAGALAAALPFMVPKPQKDFFTSALMRWSTVFNLAVSGLALLSWPLTASVFAYGSLAALLFAMQRGGHRLLREGETLSGPQRAFQAALSVSSAALPALAALTLLSAGSPWMLATLTLSAAVASLIMLGSAFRLRGDAR